MQDVFWYIKEAIDAYFGGRPFQVTVKAGCLIGRKVERARPSPTRCRSTSRTTALDYDEDADTGLPARREDCGGLGSCRLRGRRVDEDDEDVDDATKIRSRSRTSTRSSTARSARRISIRQAARRRDLDRGPSSTTTTTRPTTERRSASLPDDPSDGSAMLRPVMGQMDLFAPKPAAPAGVARRTSISRWSTSSPSTIAATTSRPRRRSATSSTTSC